MSRFFRRPTTILEMEMICKCIMCGEPMESGPEMYLHGDAEAQYLTLKCSRCGFYVSEVAGASETKLQEMVAGFARFDAMPLRPRGIK